MLHNHRSSLKTTAEPVPKPRGEIRHFREQEHELPAATTTRSRRRLRSQTEDQSTFCALPDSRPRRRKAEHPLTRGSKCQSRAPTPGPEGARADPHMQLEQGLAIDTSALSTDKQLDIQELAEAAATVVGPTVSGSTDHPLEGEHAVPKSYEEFWAEALAKASEGASPGTASALASLAAAAAEVERVSEAVQTDGQSYIRTSAATTATEAAANVETVATATTATTNAPSNSTKVAAASLARQQRRQGFPVGTARRGRPSKVRPGKCASLFITYFFMIVIDLYLIP